MPRVATSLGSSIGYTEAGSGNATPIVFLHGVGSDKSVWHPQLEHFGRERRAIAFDYPGYGDSDPAPDGTTRDDYAEAVHAALHALDVERAHICGLSLGGVVAIALADAVPNHCASLILADTFASHPDGHAIYERALAVTDLHALAEARVAVLLAQPAEPAVRREVVETMAKVTPAAYRIGAEAVWLADQGERAHDINVSTLVLCGSEDVVTPPTLSLALAELIPGARTKLIDGAGHLSNLERPEAFNAIVGSFVREVDARR